MGMRKAINAKCKDCIYDALAAGSWLEQVFQCTMEDCGLYPYRPIPRARKPKGDPKMVSNFKKKLNKQEELR